MSDTTSRSTGQAPTRMNLRPDLAALVEGIPYLDVRDPQAARATLKELEAQWEPADTSAITVAEQLIPGPEGAPDVVVRVYSPKAPGPHGGLLWIHGGGFVMGSLETEHNQCVWFASQAKCVVVSVQYRLAPEHPSPRARRTATPRCAGSLPKPGNSAWYRAGWEWRGAARAAPWPRPSPSWRATGRAPNSPCSF